MAIDSSSELVKIVATGSGDRSESGILHADANVPTSRTMRVNTSAASGSTRYFQVMVRVVRDSTIIPTQPVNLDHSRLSMSETALALIPARSMVSAMFFARVLTPPSSSPMYNFALRVNRASPVGNNSPLVSASAPSTCSLPHTACSSPFFMTPFCIESAAPMVARRIGSSAAFVS